MFFEFDQWRYLLARIGCLFDKLVQVDRNQVGVAAVSEDGAAAAEFILSFG